MRTIFFHKEYFIMAPHLTCKKKKNKKKFKQKETEGERGKKNWDFLEKLKMTSI